MRTVSIRLPSYLLERIRVLAKRDNMSLNQSITMAAAEKASALQAADILRQRAARGDANRFRVVLAKAPDNEPDPHRKCEA